MNEIEMRWNTDVRGFKAICPICGERLMLCDECQHTEGCGGCDYDSKSDTCKFNRKMDASLSVKTPLGTIRANAVTDSARPGIAISPTASFVGKAPTGGFKPAVVKFLEERDRELEKI